MMNPELLQRMETYRSELEKMDAVDLTMSFSGVVKKVIVDKNKVGIKDPETKKRFTVIVNAETKPDGLEILKDLKKKDKIEGKYTVTDAGLYIALELVRK